MELRGINLLFCIILVHLYYLLVFGMVITQAMRDTNEATFRQDRAALDDIVCPVYLATVIPTVHRSSLDLMDNVNVKATVTSSEQVAVNQTQVEEEIKELRARIAKKQRQKDELDKNITEWNTTYTMKMDELKETEFAMQGKLKDLGEKEAEMNKKIKDQETRESELKERREQLIKELEALKNKTCDIELSSLHNRGEIHVSNLTLRVELSGHTYSLLYNICVCSLGGGLTVSVEGMGEAEISGAVPKIKPYVQ